jgi:hypothetical protein
MVVRVEPPFKPNDVVTDAFGRVHIVTRCFPVGDGEWWVGIERLAKAGTLAPVTRRYAPEPPTHICNTCGERIEYGAHALGCPQKGPG